MKCFKVFSGFKVLRKKLKTVTKSHFENVKFEYFTNFIEFYQEKF